MEFFSRLFDTSGFPPRWQCGNWTEAHGWLHILSDLGVWSAYFAIPCILAYFVLRRHDLPFRGIFVLFAAFILSCGTTHLMEAIIFWWPAYPLAGAIKLATALVSWITIFALVPVIPRVLSMRTPEELERQIAARTAELVEANATLKTERERFRITLASIGDAVMVTDTSGKVTFLNEVAQQLTGWSENEAIGSRLEQVLKIINENTRQPAESPATRAIREERIVGMANHTLLITKDGQERPVEDSAAPIRDERDKVAGVVLVFRDVTDRRRKEAALKEADRRKDEFLATLAHELRNPLAPISNSVRLLRNIEPRTPQLVQIRDMVERQVGHMVRLVDDLMDVSRITRGKMELHTEALDLGTTIRNAVEASRPLIEAAGHELTLEVPDRAVRVVGDPTRLEQVMANLLNNAAKYTPEGGHIAVTVERADSWATIRVRDDGIGIPVGMLPRVFEMFAQADKRLERTHGGLGIGLTLVKRLVEMHGGTVEAVSRGEGQGSEFVVQLPAHELMETIAAPALDGTAQFTGATRVLVVDDNHDSADSLGMLLKIDGHVVEIVYDGPSALEAAKKFRPQLVLLDIGMPGMTGYDVARAMRRMPEVERALLVAQTGWGQEQDRRQSREAGFDAHLVKPVDLNTVQQLVASLKTS